MNSLGNEVYSQMEYSPNSTWKLFMMDDNRQLLKAYMMNFPNVHRLVTHLPVSYLVAGSSMQNFFSFLKLAPS